jgi:hypothetical protein
LATKTDKTTENEIWAHKTAWRFGKENHGRIYSRKKEEGGDQKGDGFRISQTNYK